MQKAHLVLHVLLVLRVLLLAAATQVENHSTYDAPHQHKNSNPRESGGGLYGGRVYEGREVLELGVCDLLSGQTTLEAVGGGGLEIAE